MVHLKCPCLAVRTLQAEPLEDPTACACVMGTSKGTQLTREGGVARGALAPLRGAGAGARAGGAGGEGGGSPPRSLLNQRLQVNPCPSGSMAAHTPRRQRNGDMHAHP